MDRIDRDKEHVALSVAAAIAYHQVNGTIEEIGGATELDAILNRVARALATVTEIYARDGGVPRPIPPADLLEGVFLRGATMFKTADGRVYKQLSLPRRGMREAIQILKAAAARGGLSLRPG